MIDSTLRILITTYANALGKHGPDSEEVKAIRASHADNAEFIDYADALDRIKRNLGGKGIEPHAPRGPWISVKDRLPPIGTGSLVDVWRVAETSKGPASRRFTNVFVADVDGQGVALWQDRSGTRIGTYTVTHWRPIPAGPTAEGGDDGPNLR